MAELKKGWFRKVLDSLSSVLAASKQGGGGVYTPEERRRIWAEQEARRERVEREVKGLMRPEHLPVLMRKYRQTVRVDEYGFIVW
jgi:hypothetical protein